MIRTNQNSSAIYVEFQERLDSLIRNKNAEAETIEILLQKLSELYTDVDEAIEIPKKMGFENKGTFEIYQIIKNESSDFDEKLVREFAVELTKKIQERIYIGWHEIPQEYNRLRGDMLLLSVNPMFESLNLDSKDELVENIMNSVRNNFSLN